MTHLYAMICAMNVKELRTKIGMTQAQLAKELDVAIFTVRRWEKGQLGMHPGNRRRLERLVAKAGIREV